MTGRRLVLLSPLALLAACAREEAPVLAPRRLDGYAYLTPLRLNVADIEVPEAAGGPAFRADVPTSLVPLAEVRRMGRDRLLPVGTTGRARFLAEAASLVRERVSSGGAFSGPTERLSLLLRCRLEVLDGGDRRVAFAEAEVRRTATVGDASGAAVRRAAEEMVGRGMDELNVEFEVQVRRNLRDWLMEAGPTAPGAPAPAPVQREDLPQG